MERESFEDPSVAAIMNEHFINIKIDREERPDLDHIYMDAVQVMTGSGGWPLNVFLTPEAKPFYGGTYFPPQKAFNRASWTDVLYGIINAFSERRNEIVSQAESLTAHLLQSNAFGEPATEDVFTKDNAQLVFENLMKTADKSNGGFGRAPKFPQTFSIQYLLRYFHFYKNEAALQQACLSLDKMIYGGIYDQAGGGFARYATDNEWLVPHFEKMLYDNALLVITLSEAYQVTHYERYAATLHQTMEFIERELMAADAGFYAALDADSEGEEGRFYVWKKEEIEAILKEDAALFCAFYDVSAEGNWEGKNILHVPVVPEKFVAGYNSETEQQLADRLARCRQQLLLHRNKRIRPALDDKMLLGWNALMNSACSKAYAATGLEKYRQLAIRNMKFILDNFSGSGEGFRHTFKNGIAKYDAFLDDYAYLIQALLHLQEITADAAYLLKAKRLSTYVIDNFADDQGAFFFFTHKAQSDIILRKKEIYDSAVPSGNSVMAANLLYLSHVFDNNGWRQQAKDMLGRLSGLITRYPGSFGVWAGQLLLLANGIKEIVVTGQKFNDSVFDILHIFIPSRILQCSSAPNEAFPLLKGKQFSYPVLIYVCENYVCRPPVTNLSSLILAIDNQ